MRILYTRTDGGVTIMNAASKAELEQVLGPLTLEAWKEFIWKTFKERRPYAIDAVEISEDYILPDRDFRNAWIQNGKEVAHDFEKATNMQLERLRLQRNEMLYEYDAIQMRATDLGDEETLKNLRAKKQWLRDCTNDLKNAKPQSIQEIKNLTPDLSAHEVNRGNS